MAQNQDSNKTGLRWVKKDATIYLEGQVDEFSDFSPLLSESAPLRLNFKSVVRLNSVGVRNLLTFIRDWGQKPLVYIECPDIVMDQLSMVKDLMGFSNRIASVESFFAPYVCDQCDHEEDVLLVVADLQGNPPKLIEKKCPKCGAEMESEISPEFLQFLDESD